MLKRHYFFGNFNLTHEPVVCLDTEIIHQIKDVLKLKESEEVVLCDSDVGKAAVAVIQKLNKKEIIFSVKNFLPVQKSEKKVVLYATLLKRDSFEWLLQKATEVGADEIVPLISERAIKVGVNEKRWQKIIKEAAEQSQSLVLPRLLPPRDLKEALKNKIGTAIFFDPSGENLKKIKIADETIALFVGPEGGWTQKELELAKEAGARLLNLGESILRAETAATIGVYLAKNIF